MSKLLTDSDFSTELLEATNKLRMATINRILKDILATRSSSAIEQSYNYLGHDKIDAIKSVDERHVNEGNSIVRKLYRKL